MKYELPVVRHLRVLLTCASMTRSRLLSRTQFRLLVVWKISRFPAHLVYHDRYWCLGKCYERYGPHRDQRHHGEAFWRYASVTSLQAHTSVISSFWLQTFRLNTRGTFFTTQLCLPHLKKVWHLYRWLIYFDTLQGKKSTHSNHISPIKYAETLLHGNVIQAAIPYAVCVCVCVCVLAKC